MRHELILYRPSALAPYAQRHVVDSGHVKRNCARIARNSACDERKYAKCHKAKRGAYYERVKFAICSHGQHRNSDGKKRPTLEKSGWDGVP